ncbi:MAG: hypothetical protein H6585_02275 [Flavobacteriales bacterium]|nr:hypothetical protein [Flavobacteriales bacterium]MCB9447154.1 hypothetical protein [Flavobacteriales bacterium]
MKRLLKIIASVVLLFNAAGAVYGGCSLIAFPDGSGMGLSTQLLAHSPFDTFLVPGIILLLVNGVFSLVVFGTLIQKYKYAARLVFLQGSLLLGWLVIQVALIRMLYFLHYVMGAVGLVLVVVGRMLESRKRKLIYTRQTNEL